MRSGLGRYRVECEKYMNHSQSVITQIGVFEKSTISEKSIINDRNKKKEEEE